MSIAFKFGIPAAAGTGMAGLGGYYFLSTGDTIGSSLKSSIESHKKILFLKGDKEWTEWKEVYGAATSGQIDKVTKEGLAEWCEATLKLSSKDKKNYDLASKWCVVNTRTVKEELRLGGTTLLEVQPSDAKWQNAWNHHNTKKDQNTSLSIGDSKIIGSGINAASGATSFHEWCTTRYSWNMYKLGASSDLEKVKMWCSSGAGDFISTVAPSVPTGTG
ncbi:hypothetical protein HF1_13870 [Mycoplasma haemofelis str. Langford 1]|uniref:Uncharacterized protein n=1 Tax=Mycoplasma haemofelis (strain Langford 1) TaxID=941640 RepID=E8ZJS4_MYCHL|nr:hypothetical protein [Mycoplasma haemofelis]CBY93395.1 hypothetical protein HF1_13870 [Mycoplasma haemofelis str. Langford 1]